MADIGLNIAEFIAKWKRADLKERSAAQKHFIDLCRVLGQRPSRLTRPVRHSAPRRARPSTALRREWAEVRQIVENLLTTGKKGRATPPAEPKSGSAGRLTPPKPSPAAQRKAKGGGFDIEEPQANAFLHAPNPHGRPNSDVVVPWVNGMDLTKRPKGKWIVDFGVGMTEDDAAKYEAIFEYIRAEVKPEREKNARESYRRLWWQHVEARPAMREALSSRSRFLCTCRVSKPRFLSG